MCLSGQSATYYFSSSTGLDSRSNNQAKDPETPLKSIDRLNSMFQIFQPGDSILFKSDESFHGTLIISKSGTLKSPIYFGCYGFGKKPSLTGLIELNSWFSKGNNIFEAEIEEINTPVSTVIIDNDIQAMGRFPNEKTNSGYLTIKSYQDGKIETNILMPFSDFTGSEVVIRKNNWIIDRHYIITNSTKAISYDIGEAKSIPMIGFGFFIQNHPLTLDTHGEWYYNKDSKKLLIYSLGDPCTNIIKVSTLKEIVTLKNKTSNIIFENITIEGSNENLISLNGSSNIVFEKCNLEYIGQNAISSVSSRNLAISNSTIRNSLNGGIFLGWDDQGTLVKNNNFENIFTFAGMGQNGEMQSQAIYMSEASSNILIEGNRFFNCGYNAINFNGNNIAITNNLIDTFCFIKDDGAGIYTFAGFSNISFTNRKIIKNIIINGIGAVNGTKPYGPEDLPYVEGIYLDRNASNVEIEGNTISNVKSKGIFINNARNVSILNNKIINTGYSIYILNDNLRELVENIIIKNNEFLAVTDKQIHYYIRSKLEDLAIMGKFDNNVFSRPLNIFETIFVQKPLSNGFVDLQKWQVNFGLDLNSTKGPLENLYIHETDIKSSKLESSIFFDYNHSNSPKTVSLIGTYIDLKGNIVSNKIEIPEYSSTILIKTKK